MTLASCRQSADGKACLTASVVAEATSSSLLRASQDPRDVEVIAGMLSSVQIDEVSYFSNLLTNLERRKAIVKTPLTNNPLIIKTPEVRI